MDIIRVGIVEDQETIRRGLVELIDAASGFQSAGDWGSMEAALPALERAPPDMALVDLGLPGISGTEGIRRLKASRPGLLTVVFSVYEDDERIFDALCAGACGYLLKSTTSARLIEGLRQAHDGGAPISPELARRVIGLFSRMAPKPREDYNLTPHEVRVLRHLVDGHSFKSAAALLQVSAPTVAFHVRRIYDKLQVHSKSAAVARALRDRVLD